MISLGTLLTAETVQTIYTLGLTIGEALGLPVTSWHPGDPTRSQYWHAAEKLATLDKIAVGYIASGFLDYSAERAEAAGTDSTAYQWLVLLAYESYGYEVDEETYATGTVRLTNGGSYLYEDIEPGDITIKSSVNEQTYHNTSGGTLAAGPATILDLDFEADEPGSDSSASIGDIDTMVTTMLDVTCSNTTAFVGIDSETPASIVTGCRNKLSSFSPNGPPGAYDYVATNAELTGTSNVTRSRTYGDSATGDVTVYLAGPSGLVAGADVTLVEAAIVAWATPLCMTPAVASATNKTINITYELWLYESVGMTEAEVKAAVEAAFVTLFLARPIGGDIKGAVGSGYVYHSMLEAAFKATFGAYFIDVSITVPASDTAVAATEVPVKGTVTATAVHFEDAP